MSSVRTELRGSSSGGPAGIMLSGQGIPYTWSQNSVRIREAREEGRKVDDRGLGRERRKERKREIWDSPLQMSLLYRRTNLLKERATVPAIGPLVPCSSFYSVPPLSLSPC